MGKEQSKLTTAKLVKQFDKEATEDGTVPVNSIKPLYRQLLSKFDHVNTSDNRALVENLSCDSNLTKQQFLEFVLANFSEFVTAYNLSQSLEVTSANIQLNSNRNTDCVEASSALLTSNNSVCFDDLYFDIIVEIAKYLLPDDISNLLVTSKRLYDMSTAVWQISHFTPRLFGIYEVFQHFESQNNKDKKKTRFDLLKQFYSEPITANDNRIYLFNRSKKKINFKESLIGNGVCWGNDNRYWAFKDTTESPFKRIHYLKQVWWFVVDITTLKLPKGTYKIDARFLHKRKTDFHPKLTISYIDFNNDNQATTLVSKRSFTVDYDCTQHIATVTLPIAAKLHINLKETNDYKSKFTLDYIEIIEQ